mgnify:CR=1 FL=1
MRGLKVFPLLRLRRRFHFGELTARAEGVRNGVLGGFDVSMTRNKCAPAGNDRRTKQDEARDRRCFDMASCQDPNSRTAGWHPIGIATIDY